MNRAIATFFITLGLSLTCSADWRPADLGEAIRAQQNDIERALQNRNVVQSRQELQLLASELFSLLELQQLVSGNVRVIRQSDVNAITVPNGDIYLYDGLISGINTVEELAFVLAHEASHVVANDLVRKMHIWPGSHSMRQMELDADRWALERLQQAGLATAKLDQLLRRLYALSQHSKTVPLEDRLKVIRRFGHRPAMTRLPDRMQQQLDAVRLPAINNLIDLGLSASLLKIHQNADSIALPEGLIDRLRHHENCSLTASGGRRTAPAGWKLKQKLVSMARESGFWDRLDSDETIIGRIDNQSTDSFLTRHGRTLDVLQISVLTRTADDCTTADDVAAVLQRLRADFEDHWPEVDTMRHIDNHLRLAARFTDAYGLHWQITETLISVDDGWLRMRLVTPGRFYHDAVIGQYDQLVSASH